MNLLMKTLKTITWPLSTNKEILLLSIQIPDLLVSGTPVVSSLFCQCKAVLSERFCGVEPTYQVMLNGLVVHRLLSKVCNLFLLNIVAKTLNLHLH